jgi:hypothetical protein
MKAAAGGEWLLAASSTRRLLLSDDIVVKNAGSAALMLHDAMAPEAFVPTWKNLLPGEDWFNENGPAEMV